MNLAFCTQTCGKYVLHTILFSGEAPSASAGIHYAQEMQALKLRVNRDWSRVRMLVITDGWAPNAVQRRWLNEEILEGRSVCTAVLSNALENPLKRGVATAFAWMNPEFRTFEPDAWTQAMAHLDLVRHELFVWDTLVALQVGLRPNQTLAGIAEYLGRRRPRPTVPWTASIAS